MPASLQAQSSVFTIPQQVLNAGDVIGPLITGQLPAPSAVGWTVGVNLVIPPAPNAVGPGLPSWQVDVWESPDGVTWNENPDITAVIGNDYKQATWALNRPTPVHPGGFMKIQVTALKACTLSGSISI